MLKEAIHRWSATDASELYEVARWGKGYFSIHESGHLLVHPEKDPRRSVDLAQLVEQIGQRGVDLPVLLRFGGILRDRLREIYGAFGKAIHNHNYRGSYTCVYPVKVNPQRQVVEEVLEHGRRYAVGLEAGSKPELLAVVALADPTTPIICNGFKDAEYIEMALLAQKIGRRVIPVVERFTELELILATAGRLGVRPQIGVRVKLAARGAGRWQSSAGYRSKFGLCASEILATLDESGSVLLDPIIKGDTVRDVLRYVQLDEDKLIQQLTSAINEALQTGRLDQQEADRMLKFYQDRLHSYTYLQEPHRKEMMKEKS